MATDCSLGFLLEIVLDEDKHIDVDLGSGEVTATIAAGTYDTIFDLIAEAETQLETLDATFDVVLLTGLSLGRVSIGRTGTYTIKWATGTNTATSLGSYLGFDTSADDSGAATYTSDNVNPNSWFSPHGPAFDSYDRKQSMGPRTFVALSSKTKRSSFARHQIRQVNFETLEPEVFFESDASTNEAFETYWELMAEGTPFNVYTDVDQNPATSWTDQGQYGLEVEENANMLDNVPRLDPGSAFYSIGLRMRKAP